MKVFCAQCQKFMGEISITGQLRKGYAALSIYVLCGECNEPEEPKGGPAGDFNIDSLLNLFGMREKK
jgi:hypothetical protein